MEITVQVKDEQEAYLMQVGLKDEDIRTFIKIVGCLKAMDDITPEQNRRKQVLHAVCCLFGCDKTTTP